MTDELLARRILALEERVERVEATRPPTWELVLNTLADFRQDTADRFDRLEGRVGALEGRMDRLEGRMDRLEGRMDALEHRMDERFAEMDKRFDQVIRLLGGDPGPS